MTKTSNETRLDLTSVDDPICQELFGKLEGAGLSVAVWDITSNIAIAAFACFIVPRNDNRTVALLGSHRLWLSSSAPDRARESIDRSGTS